MFFKILTLLCDLERNFVNAVNPTEGDFAVKGQLCGQVACFGGKARVALCSQMYLVELFSEGGVR